MKPSRVAAAMGLAPAVAESAIRVSFGASTGEADVERFLGEWRRIRNRGTDPRGTSQGRASRTVEAA
jgi:cysteine sulfinate desulfinase/cysteine desulfurase-like protein